MMSRRPLWPPGPPLSFMKPDGSTKPDRLSGTGTSPGIGRRPSRPMAAATARAPTLWRERAYWRSALPRPTTTRLDGLPVASKFDPAMCRGQGSRVDAYGSRVGARLQTLDSRHSAPRREEGLIPEWDQSPLRPFPRDAGRLLLLRL